MISFSLFATYQDFDKYKGLFTHLHMNSLNIIVDFSTYMYFRELKDLARYGTFSRCTSTRSSEFRECDSFLDKSQSLNCVYDMFEFVLSVEQDYGC